MRVTSFIGGTGLGKGVRSKWSISPGAGRRQKMAGGGAWRLEPAALATARGSGSFLPSPKREKRPARQEPHHMPRALLVALVLPAALTATGCACTPGRTAEVQHPDAAGCYPLVCHFLFATDHYDRALW